MRRKRNIEYGLQQHFEDHGNRFQSVKAFAIKLAKVRLGFAILNAGVPQKRSKLSLMDGRQLPQVNTLSTVLLGLFPLPKLDASEMSCNG
jgi:hypothetical protein